MRIAFGLLSLVVVLAIVGMLAKRSLQALPARATATASVSDAPLHKPQELTRKVADDVNKLMQQAPARIDGDDR